MKNILKNFYRKINKNYQAEFIFKKELSYFKDAKNILDIGCGNGDFIALDTSRIIGVDSNKKSVNMCKQKNLKAIYALATKLPFRSSDFDGVHCSHVIEHLYPQEAYKMLTEISRVLKKDGIFVLSSPLLWSGFYNNFTHVKPYNPESIIRYLVDNGSEKTFSDFKARFKKLDLYWRFRPLPLPTKLGKIFSNFLYQYNIHLLKRDAYILVLRKL